MSGEVGCWKRVQHNKTGERAWANLHTKEIFTDSMMRSLLKATEDGAVVGNPAETTEWLSAERSVDVEARK